MKSNNFKTVLFAFLIATIMLPLGSINLVEANETDSTKNVVIKTEKFRSHIMDDAAKKLGILDQKLEDASNSAKEDDIIRKMQQIKQDTASKLPEISQAKLSEYNRIANGLTDKLSDENSQSADKRIVPFTSVGYNSHADAILVGIEPVYITPQNMETYANFIDGVVPNHIKVIVQPGEIWTVSSCPRISSNCDPIEGGIQMEVDGYGSCTVGFKATYRGVDGFVTAGHCADGNTGNDVGQPTLSRIIGTVIRETFDADQDPEFCDCAFIQSTISVAQEIFGLSDRYYPDHTYNVSNGDWVKVFGAVSGKKIGYVTESSTSVLLHGSNTVLRDVAFATYDSTFGDSGGPVTEAFSGDPGFVGTHAASHINGKSAFVKHYQFTNHFSGLSWGF